MSKRLSEYLRVSSIRIRRKEKFVQTYSFGMLRRTELHVLCYIVRNYFYRFFTGCSLINDAISCNFIWIKREQEGQLADSRSSSFLINFLQSLHLNLNSNFLATLSATILLPYELLSPPRRRCNRIDAFFSPVNHYNRARWINRSWMIRSRIETKKSLCQSSSHCPSCVILGCPKSLFRFIRW